MRRLGKILNSRLISHAAISHLGTDYIVVDMEGLIVQFTTCTFSAPLYNQKLIATN